MIDGPVEGRLSRTVGVAGAVVLGLGSIVGTGIFVGVGLATAVAGPAVVFAVAVAALVATANGLSSAQLAAAHPVSGGTYEYGYRFLRPSLGFAAGWMFLVAKSASAATAALGVALYLTAGTPWDGRPARTAIALGLVALVVVLVLSGLRRSTAANGVLVTVTVGALGAFVALGAPRVSAAAFSGGADPRSFLEATALLFVAYTGYGRIATLGEEIREPARNIPRAMIATLAVTTLLYLAVAAVLVGVGGAAGGGDAPLEAAALAFSGPALARVVAVGAVMAMAGVLLNLVLGLSRVLLAMGRRGDMPRGLARVDETGTTPAPAVIATGVGVALLVLLGDVVVTWSLSAFTVLLYYALTNAAALRLPAQNRRFPRLFAWLGLAGCLFLAFWVETAIWMVGAGLVVLGLAGWRWLGGGRPRGAV